MICCPSVRKSVIRRHYDAGTLLYRLLWGPHIHHGLWYGNESAADAQLQLIESLASLARLTPGARILDVGCGMGASAIHLAKNYDARVTGLTISPVQRHWAALASRFHRTNGRTRFLCGDADAFQADSAAWDVVWSIECTEHLFDKPEFFRRAADWLRPGGCVAICAWLAGDTRGNATLERQVFDVCEGFYCPSLGTADEYRAWLQVAGLSVETTHDWTANVQRTWEICRQRVARRGVRQLARLLDANASIFLDRFDTLLNAYRSGAMRYGCLVARKPTTSGSIEQPTA